MTVHSLSMSLPWRFLCCGRFLFSPHWPLTEWRKLKPGEMLPETSFPGRYRNSRGSPLVTRGPAVEAGVVAGGCPKPPRRGCAGSGGAGRGGRAGCGRSLLEGYPVKSSRQLFFFSSGFIQVLLTWKWSLKTVKLGRLPPFVWAYFELAYASVVF